MALLIGIIIFLYKKFKKATKVLQIETGIKTDVFDSNNEIRQNQKEGYGTVAQENLPTEHHQKLECVTD